MNSYYSILVLVALLGSMDLHAQSDSNRFNYQAILRNSNGETLANKNVSVKFVVRVGDAQGNVVFEEVHSATTSDLGLLNLKVGSIQSLMQINWQDEDYFLETSIDNVIMGTTQLLGVPAALYATKAGTALTMDYENIINTPNFSNWDSVAMDDFNGDYKTLANKPLLFSGTFDSLQNRPDIFNGDFTSLTNVPDIFSGDYEDLSNRPTLFSGDYARLKNKPVHFTGGYYALSNRPTLFDGDFYSLSSRPLIFAGNYIQLSNLPALFSGDFDSLTNKPLFFNGEYSSLSNRPSVFSESYSDLSNLPDLFTGTYDSLLNAPPTIAPEQSVKINVISLSSALDLDVLSTETASNSAKSSFPGFGESAGMVMPVYWSQINDNVYFEAGRAVIGSNLPNLSSEAFLQVHGSVWYDGASADTTSGLAYYDPSGRGLFRYYNNDGVGFSLGTDSIKYIGSLWGLASADFQAFADVNISGRLIVGRDATAGYDFKDYNMVFRDKRIQLLFDDTSTSGSFPKVDWRININDSIADGKSYFAIADHTAMKVPFQIEAATADTTLYVSTTGDIGIFTSQPTAKLDVQGDVTATSFVGNANLLAGLTGATSTTINTGSTTLASDANNDGNGDITFEIGTVQSMTISNDGYVGIGETAPTEALVVNGEGNFKSLHAGNMDTGGILLHAITNDISVGPISLVYDVTDKSVVVFNPTAGILTLNSITGGVPGQRIIVINKGTYAVNFPYGSGFYFPTFNYPIELSLGQNATATFLYNGNGWYCEEAIIQTP